MTAALPSTAVGVFDDSKQAEAAVKDLRQAGFDREQIGVAVRHEPAGGGAPPPGAAPRAGEAGVTGVLAGGAFGGLLGAAAATLIPGVGPVLGAGALAAVLGGVTAGAVAGGVVGALAGMGVPEEDARYYQQELEAGRTLVTVKAGDRYDQAVGILKTHGARGKGKPLI